ncbi:TetR/AcrR family transcriptional regulator [Candidatus Berkiella cookevillensis]|uniref:HTH-type transcriptional repressor KstR2 n=1 Tax=Candidatus Berkiella cookevillensis TaxID=437022 RepID=A0A0Q9YNK1_9GAMM|nr:TetR/AcrR family transcriptional regulator [Candidatus Berkiella cookevillensis]MCS5708149.1 TetR/AcrR family transcriptional regulator [Candidatus Berkiella cookevillensis]
MRDGSATRKKLDRCALNLFVQKGITATTIKDIASEAEVAEGTLYRHYKSKEELAQSLFVNSYEAILVEMRAIIENLNKVENKIHDMVMLFARKFDEDPILFRYLLLTQHYQMKYLANDENSAHHLFVQVVVSGMNKHQIPKGDADVYAAMIIGIVLQAAVSRVYERITRKMVEDVPVLSAAILRVLQAKDT